jgi:hypothetical protein
LKKEVCVERNSWLNEGHIHYFLDGVEQNPMKSLMRWQEISRDCSFKPLTKAESQLQEIQAAQILEHVHSCFLKKLSVNYPKGYQAMQKVLFITAKVLFNLTKTKKEIWMLQSLLP